MQTPAASAARASPLSILEGVQVAAARVDQPSEIAFAAYMRLQFIAIQQTRR